ncbi:MAG: sensor histidine kinase [Sedimentibacter sp.]
MEIKSLSALYFIYGLSFFVMGVLALNQQGNRVSNIAFIKYIKYLGYFGIVHGISEWMSMIISIRFYPGYEIWIYIFKIFLKAVSSCILMYFGLNIIASEGKLKKYIRLLPILLFVIWTIGFQLTFMKFISNFSWLPVYSVITRYFIGFPADILTAIGLYKQGKRIDDVFMGIHTKFNLLAILFLIYSLLSGLLVSKTGFFPANIINKELFFNLFGFPVEVGRTTLAIGITMLFTKIIRVISWEMEEQILRMSMQQGMEQERAKMGRDLHDCIIQELFAIGLQLNNYMVDGDDQEKLSQIKNIRDNINGTILKIRDFIGNVSTKEIEMSQLKDCLLELIDSFKVNYFLNVDFDYNVNILSIGYLSSEKLTQVYYIVQEVLSNIVKHANATLAKVEINSNLSSVKITVADNGKGFNLKEIHNFKGYGIKTIKERVALADGTLKIESSSKGTRISIVIPWEV